MEAWATGKFTDRAIDGTKQLNAEAIGKCQAYDDVAWWITDERKES